MNPSSVGAGAVTAVLAFGAGAAGQNVDLSTAPPREATQLTIYNSADLTLVRELRTMTLQRGDNALQFSWSGTLIDPTSVMLTFPGNDANVEVLDTTFPHERPESLEWTVRSDVEGAVPSEISYFTSGVSWAADYVATTTADERSLALEGNVRLTNGSGADFAGAQVRLVVGEINLIESVRDLARRGLITDEQKADFDDLGIMNKVWAEKARNEVYAATRLAFAPPGSAPLGGMGGGGGLAGAPPEIIKEGLSEYFIFTVEGTQDVPHGASRRLRLFDGLAIENDIRYRYRPEEYGEQLARLFIVPNDEEHELGTTPLPDGAVRVFRANEGDTLSLLAVTRTKYVPIGQDIEMLLGADELVRLEQRRVGSGREDFWFHRHDDNQLVDIEGARRIAVDLTVAGWVDRDTWTEHIVNDRLAAVHVEIRRRFPGDVTVEVAPGVKATRHDYQTPEFETTVPGRARVDIRYTTRTRQGTLRKQDRVVLQ